MGVVEMKYKAGDVVKIDRWTDEMFISEWE